MKYVFQQRVKAGSKVDLHPKPQDLIVDGADVQWLIEDGDGLLAGLTITYRGGPVVFTDRGTLETDVPELQSRAYRLACYFSDQLFLQTGVDALDPSSVLDESPTVEPETAEEVELFAKTPRSRRARFSVSWSVRNDFDTGRLVPDFSKARAHGYVAAARRQTNEFKRYEEYYKVLEYFFPEDSEAFDRAVCSRLTTAVPGLTVSAVETIRHLRNRVVHPRARRGHANPGELAHIAEVRSQIVLLERLAIAAINTR